MQKVKIIYVIFLIIISQSLVYGEYEDVKLVVEPYYYADEGREKIYKMSFLGIRLTISRYDKIKYYNCLVKEKNGFKNKIEEKKIVEKVNKKYPPIRIAETLNDLKKNVKIVLLNKYGKNVLRDKYLIVNFDNRKLEIDKYIVIDFILKTTLDCGKYYLQVFFDTTWNKSSTIKKLRVKSKKIKIEIVEAKSKGEKRQVNLNQLMFYTNVLKDYKKAIKVGETIIKKDKEFYIVYQFLGIAYEKLGEKRKALDCFNYALKEYKKGEDYYKYAIPINHIIRLRKELYGETEENAYKKIFTEIIK